MSREAYDPRNMSGNVEPGLEATAYWETPDFTYPFSVNVAVVEIDQDTGQVKLTDYIAVADFGTVVNPMVVDGQVHGGLAQGIGAALLEEALWDNSGQLVTGSFMDYALPLADEFPMFTLAGIPQIKPTFLGIAPSGIPSNIIPHSKGIKCGLIRSNSPFSYSNHRPAKPKIPKPLVYAQVSPLGTSFATP